MTAVNENSSFVDVVEIIETDNDICEICYSNKIDIDISCFTCKKSTCIKCCNLNKSRKYDYTPKDKCCSNELQNEMSIQYDCPYCRTSNNKSICDFNDKNVIMKAFDRNTNDFSTKNVLPTAKMNENVIMLKGILEDLVNRDLETNDTKYYDEQFLLHSKGLNDWNLEYIEEFEQKYFHINMINAWEHYTEPQRMLMIYRYRSMIFDVERVNKELTPSYEINIDLLSQIDNAERKLAFNNLVSKERDNIELINERKKNKELTDKYNKLAIDYNKLVTLFKIASNGTAEIFENIVGAINNVKKSSKKQTINIIKKYLNNTITMTVDIQSV